MIWRITAEQSERAQGRAAAAFRRRGLRQGDRVALVLPNSPDLLATVLGALRSGVVPVLLHPGLLPAERQALLDDADPGLVIDDPAGLPTGEDEADELDLHPVPRARPMHYTSGTSGRPKGVWTGVYDDADAQALFDDEVGPWQFTSADTTFIASPLIHSAAVRFSAMTLLTGGDVLLADKFDAAEAAEAFRDHRPTAAFTVPAHLQRLFAHGLTADDAASFRLLIHAGAPCPPSLKHQALDTFPTGSVWEFYGSTEGQFTVCGPEDWLAHPGSVGRARPQRTITTDDDGQVWCHAPPFARFEYWRDPAKTAEAWRGGAFTVGDIGRLDDDGFLYLDGRRDDLVITGGVNVYPAEVEQALTAMAGVHEAAVFGAPDERWGQRVCAAIVADPAVTAAAVHAHARATLSGHKRPKDVYLVDDLPRTVTGKVRRLALVHELGLG